MATDYVTMETPDTLLAGDSYKVLEFLIAAGAADFDSIVADAPYGVGVYDAQDWGGVPKAEHWNVLLRAVKPGAFMVASGHPRTFHRAMVNMEDGGWKIKDTLVWLFSASYAQKRGDAQWAMHKELMGKRATIQRGIGRPEARQWADFGSALYPRWEPVILAQAPGEPLAKNLIKHGVGAINQTFVPGAQLQFEGTEDQYYAPPNVIVEPDVMEDMRVQYSQSISRYFYTRTRSATHYERHLGCEGIERGNDHPTVKPVEVMRWFVRLVTPYGGTVLDPYAGSGSIGIAAAMENCVYTGIDLDPEYMEIARRRINAWRARKAQEEIKTRPKPKVVVRSRPVSAGRAPAKLKPSSALPSHCRNGHPLSRNNIYMRPNGKWECMLCKRLNRRRGKR